MDALGFLQKLSVPDKMTGAAAIGDHCIALERRVMAPVNAYKGGFSITPPAITTLMHRLFTFTFGHFTSDEP